MKSLVIIGNGFDLFHGLKTKYTDFGDYLERNNSEFFYLLNEHFDADLWSDFEIGLGKLNIQSVVEDGLDIVSDDPDDEHAMRTQALIADNTNSIINKLIIDLKNSICKWILNLDYDSINSEKFNCVSNNCDFITFNYTNTLEFLYKIQSKNIIYLHNKATMQNVGHDESDSDIIIGHNVKKYHGNNYQSLNLGVKDWFLEDAFEDAEDYFSRSFKNWEENLYKLDGIIDRIGTYKSVYIMGHSLSDVDIEYFKYLTKKMDESVVFHITYYGTNERELIKDHAEKFLGGKFKTIYYDLSDDERLIAT